MKSMGGVAVLHPQDSINNHLDNFFSSPSKSNPNVNFHPIYTNYSSQTPSSTVSNGRRRTPAKGSHKRNHRNTEAVVTAQPAPAASKNLVVGQIKLLKHGESLNGSSSTIVSKQMKNNTTEFFAGSAFVESPPPSSVPLPGFFTKKFVAAVRDDPTTDLRRILGLSLS